MVKPFTKEHCNAISEGLKRYYRESAYTKTKKGLGAELRQKKAILLSMLRKQKQDGTNPKLAKELKKIGSDIHALGVRLKKNHPK